MRTLTTFDPHLERWFFALLFAIGLNGCGSGGEDAIGIVTPLDGAWETAQGDQLRFDSDSLGGESFPMTFPVIAQLFSNDILCGESNDIDLDGEIDRGQLTLYLSGGSTDTPCLEGEFTDLRRLVVSTQGSHSKTEYLNSRVDVALPRGYWTDGAEDPLNVVFTQPFSVDNDSTGVTAIEGCLLASDTNAVFFAGLLDGFVSASKTPPKAPTLQDEGGQLVFSDLAMTGRDTLTVRDASGHRHELQRRPRTASIDNSLPGECQAF